MLRASHAEITAKRPNGQTSKCYAKSALLKIMALYCSQNTHDQLNLLIIGLKGH